MDGRVAAIRSAPRHRQPPTTRPSSAMPPSSPRRILRPLPRGRTRLRTAVRRPPHATRWTEPTAAKPCAKSCRTSPRSACDMIHGEARDALPRHHPRRTRAIPTSPSAPTRSPASTPCFHGFAFPARLARPPSAPCFQRLPGIRRAGADFIVTYFAKDAANTLAGITH